MARRDQRDCDQEADSAHPIHRLPDELLAMVLLEWLDCSSRPFWGNTLKAFNVALYSASVCRWWRRVALETPKLWRVVDISLGRAKATSGRKNVRWTEYAETCLARAATVTFDFSISGLLPLLENNPGAPVIARCLARARSVNAEVGISDCGPDNVFLRFMASDAPLLEFFWLGFVFFTEHRVQQPIQFFPSAPRLRELHAFSPGPTWAFTPDSCYPCVTNVVVAAQRLGSYDALSLLSRLPNLRKIDSRLMVFSEQETAQDYELYHPVLDELTMRVAAEPNARVMRALRFPALRKADINVGLRPPDTALAMIEHTLARVEHLTLRCGVDARLLPGLATHKHLKRLVLHGYGEGAEQFFAALASPEMCPTLEELGLTWRVPTEALRLAILHLANKRPGLRKIDVDHSVATLTRDPALEQFRREIHNVLAAANCQIQREHNPIVPYHAGSSSLSS